MKKIKYSDIAIGLGLIFLAVLYLRSRKDATAAVKTITPIGDSPKPVGDTGSSGSSGSSSGNTNSSSSNTGSTTTGPVTNKVPVLSLGGVGGGGGILKNYNIVGAYSGNTTANSGGLTSTSGTSGNNATAGNTGSTTANTNFSA